MRDGNDGKKGKDPRERLRGLLAESEALRDRLSALRQDIPPSAEELADEDLPEYPDVETEIRATIGTVLSDHLDPLIEALILAVAYEPARRQRA
jgi:hypothetical protein